MLPTRVKNIFMKFYDGNFFKLPFTTAVGDKNDEGNRDCDSLEIHFYAYARLIYYSITCNFLKIKNFNYKPIFNVKFSSS